MVFAGFCSSDAFYNVVFGTKCWPDSSHCKHESSYDPN